MALDAAPASPSAVTSASSANSSATIAPTSTTAAAAASTTSGEAIFDYSSYTGGAPSLLTVAPAASSGVGDAAGLTVSAAAASLFGQELDAVSQELVAAGGSSAVATVASAAAAGGGGAKALELDERRIGRPSHPAWEHFVRGEKRNRFHHNAYCRYCAAHGVDPEPIRGVSENMIRHLHKCLYCPEDVVAQLKMLCAQKDAERFSKRHQSHPTDVDMLLHESSPSNKRAKRNTARTTVSAHPIPLPADVAASSSDGGVTPAAVAAAAAPSGEGDAQVQTRRNSMEDEFMPLQLPLLPSEISSTAATQNALRLQASAIGTTATAAFASKHSGGPANATRPGSIHAKARLQHAPAKRTGSTSALARSNSREHLLSHQGNGSKSLSSALLNRLVQSATLAAGLPWDWVWMKESARIFGELHSQLETPRASSLASLAAAAHEQQFSKMKDELVGVTLTISSWVSAYQKTNFALFSLVNALGEASVWELLDLGLEEPTSDVFAEKIKNVLVALQDQSIQVINIVADSTNGFAAARFAVSALEHSNHDIPVLPCFSQFLSLLLGAVLTVSDVYVETMGDVIEIVQTFSNRRALKVLRRECGDPDASLVLPAKDNWYSFIECIDSVRQYEDMIKIIASKVLAASSSGSATASASGSSVDFSGGGSSAAPSLSGVARPTTRKDSAGGAVDELADTHLSSSVLRAILSPEFWENVVSLSELMSPIKETHKIMTSGAVSQFSISDVFYQFGRMHQQYGNILSDWEDNTLGRRTLEHVRFLQVTVNKMWKLYDQPLMFLSYILNYNLVYPYLSLSHPSLQWLSIGKYAKEYFRRWFCSTPPLRGPAPRLPLSEDTASRFLEDILAFKERKYPFDTESVCEFENPRSFYLLVSDSNPLMHLFGSRLFSFATSTPPLSDVVQGSSFISSASSSVCPREVLLPDLQMKLFAQTKVRPSKDVTTFLQNGRPRSSGETSGDESISARMVSLSGAPSLHPSATRSHPVGQASHKDELQIDCGMDPRACSTVWNKKQWARLAGEWRAHWEKETNVDELLRNLALLDPALFRFAPNFSLDQIFKDKLPSRLPQDREEAVVDV